jgi:ubiquinone/menaquinone biosynthesis C-methylase UbiE
LEILPDGMNLRCVGCGRQFEIREGIPVMLDEVAIHNASEAFYEEFPKILNKRNFDVYFQRRWDKIVKNAGIAKLGRGHRILEVGSGEGNSLIHLREKTGAELFGVDYAFRVCRAALEHPDEAIHVVQGDACGLPFDDGFFDFVYANAVLHHIVDQRKAVGEIVRVVKPGGGIAFIEPNRFHPLQVAYGVLDKTERGTLTLNVGRIRRYLLSTGRIESVRVLPLNTFLYSYRKFPSDKWFDFVRAVEAMLDVPLLCTHYIIAAG